jgi:hypothetical protein
MAGQLLSLTPVIDPPELVQNSGVRFRYLVQYLQKADIKQVAGEGLWNHSINVTGV